MTERAERAAQSFRARGGGDGSFRHGEKILAARFAPLFINAEALSKRGKTFSPPDATFDSGRTSNSKKGIFAWPSTITIFLLSAPARAGCARAGCRPPSAPKSPLPRNFISAAH